MALLALVASPVAGDRGADVARLVEAARRQTATAVVYDGSYRRIGYPMGDVPENVGVCTDLVVRAYRALGIDLQRLVHEDMRAHFSAYPRLWGLARPDSNIDHRRVPNLATFLSRHGEVLGVSDEPARYAAGDIVTWMLPGNLPHVGIVSDATVAGGSRRLILHNIGAGPVEDDILFRFRITGHYRYPR